ncbi:hypothetical protein DT73_21275 [Mangrovibacter sp. MFB070]|nr:hypothetical protein DT73_21275 [Mangrovibacter sp. MFB070]
MICIKHVCVFFDAGQSNLAEKLWRGLLAEREIGSQTFFLNAFKKQPKYADYANISGQLFQPGLSPWE